MRVVRWHAALETGDQEVDEQHRALYLLVNELNAASLMGNDSTFVSSALTRVLRYATTHFETEEALMRRASYPHVEAHVKKHQAFTHKANELVAAHAAGHGPSVRELARFMNDWLHEHIGSEDRPLIEHVRSWRLS